MAGDDFAVEAFTLLAIAIVTIAIRIVARWFTAGWKNFMLDDYLMPLAGVVYGLETGAAYCVSAWWKGLANNAMTDAERAALSPSSEEYHLRVGGSKTQVLGWSLYTTLLWLLKSCMAVFYSRLTAGLINMHIRIRIAYVLIAVTYIAVILSILVGCHPIQKNWQINPNPGNYCQPAVSHIDVYVTVVLNVATDVYLISIPTPILFKARLPWREKLELLILFSGGTFVMACGILRCVLIVTAGANGASQAGSWACRETFVAVIIGNAPMIYPMCRRLAMRAGWYMSTKGTKGSSQSYPLSEGAAHSGTDNSKNKRRKFKHPLSLPDTQWNTISDEQMMLPPGEWEVSHAARSNGDGNRTDGNSSNGVYDGGWKGGRETVVSTT
ncbi:hypothetical protein CBS147353_6625 [Aspergillus niger]|nr:hypothetical protein CBS147353_6625 [Aspergillus niger]